MQKLLTGFVDFFNPTDFPRLAEHQADWTGNTLAKKLESLDPNRPSHRKYAQAIKQKLTSLINNTWEGKKFGSISGVRIATKRNEVSVVCKDYLLDYYEVEQFLKS